MPLEPSPAVLRACDVLGYLAKHPTERFSVSKLARSVGSPRATCDSVLRALAERGMVHRSPDLRYTLGAACRVLGDAAQVAGAGLLAIEPTADALARATSSCVAVSSCDGGTTRSSRCSTMRQRSPSGPGWASRCPWPHRSVRCSSPGARMRSRRGFGGPEHAEPTRSAGTPAPRSRASATGDMPSRPTSFVRNWSACSMSWPTARPIHRSSTPATPSSAAWLRVSTSPSTSQRMNRNRWRRLRPRCSTPRGAWPTRS